MRSHCVVVLHVLTHDITQLLLVEHNHPIETLRTNRPNEPFSVRVHVRRVRNGRDTRDPILVIRKPFQFAGIIMNEIDIGKRFSEIRELISEKLNIRICRDA